MQHDSRQAEDMFIIPVTSLSIYSFYRAGWQQTATTVRWEINHLIFKTFTMI